MKITSGMTRSVIVAGNYAVKVPSFKSWRLFLTGLLSNMQERDFSGVWEWLCPVVWCAPGGWILIMKRAQPVCEDGWDVLLDTVPEHIQEMAETKPHNYGWLNGKLVAVDYGS